ncbi:MAG: glycosyltransferase family 2 protein [Anaerolineales bacterium]|nr:glycosyltransferase family 2 protein [Anaerolineales bacterium]
MKVSIVVPVFNEVETVSLLGEALYNALQGIDYEILFVDDGSTDGSLEALKRIIDTHPETMRVIEFRRNFGQTAAMAAGIDHSTGDVIVTIDADLQNDPEDIPKLIEKIDEGYDVVSGWRVDRKDNFVRRLPSQIANWIISKVTGVDLHDYGCTLKAYRREVLEGFHLYGEMHRFIPAYAGWVGARIVEVPVQHHSRKYGQAKYGLERTGKVILDLFTVKFLISFSNKPIYLFGGTGLVLIALSIIDLLVLVMRRLTVGEHMIRSPLLLMSVMLFILGFQSILLGLIAELMVRTYYESQSKAPYSIRSVYPDHQAH